MKRTTKQARGGAADNAAAMAEGPVKKNWTKHDLVAFQARSARQTEAIRAYMEGNHVGLFGTAGTGKTLTACYLAATSLTGDEDIRQIIVIRSAVQTREIGFLPGTIEEKQAPYEEPYEASFGRLFGKVTTWKHMKDAGKVQFRLSSFLRGLTFDNAVVIVDEAQNMTFDELNTIVTRLGHSSRLIILGDTKQIDLVGMGRGISGLEALCEIMRDVKDFSATYFTRHDIVRSQFVKSWIAAVEDYDSRSYSRVAA